ncbi:23385_t:CDS:2 [Entrophospora sp. SA101]|nr:23385_t:CDS:2 [Entrophospora sp. SA101]
MVKVNQPPTGFQPTNSSQFQNHSQPATFNSQEPNTQATQPKGLFQIPPAFLQWLPLLPLLLEQATGQKIPPMGGTMGEIQSVLQQVQFNLSQLLNKQQQIFSRLESLENNASNQLNNLSQQVASTNKSFHLLATETKRSLEFNPLPQPKLDKEVKPSETKPAEALTEVKPKPMSLYSKEELERINKFRERQVKAQQLQAQKESK